MIRYIVNIYDTLTHKLLQSQALDLSQENENEPSIIANWKYQKPTKGGSRGLKKLLKYASYRENPEHSALPLDERWMDCGLGGNWREVQQNCQRLAGPYVLAHHLVIAPAPDLMALVPEELRYGLVRETTERVVEQWHLE